VRFAIRLLVMLALVLSATSVQATSTADTGRSTPGGSSAAPGSSADPSATRSTATHSTPDRSATTSSAATRSSTAPSATGRTAARVTAPAVRITSGGSLRRLRPTTVGRATFSYTANRVPGLRFQCKLNGPGQRGIWHQNCPITGSTATTVMGAMSYRLLTAQAKPYTFTVQAYIPAVLGAGGTVVSPRSEGRPDTFAWYIYSLMTRDHYVPRTGLHFNYPLGNTSSVRRNLTHVIRTIDSMPGYRQPYQTSAPCRSSSVSRIRISLYSLTDQPVAKALMAAAKRCVSVQVLMNNHLTSSTDPAWHRLQSGLGARVFSGRVPRPSFAHRCSFGCLGSGVLHTKMYLFDSFVPWPRRAWNKVVATVMTGSTNMTFNAAKVQWNDLYTVSDNPRLYNIFGHQFDRMKRDNGFHRTNPVNAGNYQVVFSPARVGLDPYLSDLRSIHCTGARGAGVHGRSIVYINMHAWFGSRGLAIARQVRGMYNQGCYVRVLYGFMSYGVYSILHRHTGGRMSVRRTVFSHNGVTAYLYSHFKNIAVSGYVDRARNARVSWTGSNNFTNDGTHFDEVTLRINSASVYNAYVRQFVFMRDRMSSATYANFSEPSGGGRAPRAFALAPFGRATLDGTPLGVAPGTSSELAAPPGTPTITAPGITVDANGVPHAAD
jgi:hypothetical protein